MKDLKDMSFWQFLGVVIVGGIIFDGIERVVAAAASGKTEDERYHEMESKFQKEREENKKK